MQRILFVCTGNICRSPTAEGLFRARSAAIGLAGRFEADSAGTVGYHVGERPSAPAIRIAAEHGVDLGALRARRLEAVDFARFDLALGMDRGHLEAMRGLAPVTPDTTLAVSGEMNRPPMERSAGILARYAAAKALAAQIDYTLDETGTGGGSDGNFTAALGIPTLDGMGAVGNSAHSPGEFVVMPALPRRAALIAGLLQTL